MKARSRLPAIFPTEVVRAKKLTLTTSEVAPQLSIADVELSLGMSQVNTLYREQSPQEIPRNGSARVVSNSKMRNALFSQSEPSPVDEPIIWSAAVGHASTGKSGRVIERLQGDIDRLHREKQLLKLQHEDSEKAYENLSSRNQHLEDRNSNYEQSHEANQRALSRRERQVEELREELNKESQRTAEAEERAQTAAISENQWREQANQAKAVAAQKAIEYDTIVACRSMDNDRHQGGLDRIRRDFEDLLGQRVQDREKYRKLEVIAEQQRQTISQLEDLTRRLQSNFKAYRTEIDDAVADLRGNCSANNTAVVEKLHEMTRVTGEMRWILNVEKTVNHRPSDLEETSFSKKTLQPQLPHKSSTQTPTVTTTEVKKKHWRKSSIML